MSELGLGHKNFGWITHSLSFFVVGYRLRLRRKQITDAGLKEVAKLAQLKEIYLRGTKVTKSGVAQLQKALPKCEIDSNPTK